MKPTTFNYERFVALEKENKALRNELCLKCGRYKESHNGACDGCRWKGADDER